MTDLFDFSIDYPPVPQWLIKAFAEHGYHDMTDLGRWAHAMFSKGEYVIELTWELVEGEYSTWYAMATIDGDTYADVEQNDLREADDVTRFVQSAEPLLNQLYQQ